MFACSLGLGVSIGTPQEVEAEPFGNQGHWVPLANGGAECMTHWWLNQCKVGDIEEPGDQ